jgi:hypothetical protein
MEEYQMKDTTGQTANGNVLICPMLTQVAEGVLVHQSELLQNNAVVVQGRAGVLLIDPGIQGSEMACLANDLRELGQPVVAGFSTHPHWDHVLWHADLCEAPRYGTDRCAAYMRDLLSNADWKARVAEVLPPRIAEEIPLDLFGLITGLPAGSARIPWEGPEVRIIELPAHAQGHAEVVKPVEASGSDFQAAVLSSSVGSLIQAAAGRSRILGSLVVANRAGCRSRASVRASDRCWAVTRARP